jgi:hypothetical protein
VSKKIRDSSSRDVTALAPGHETKSKEGEREEVAAPLLQCNHFLCRSSLFLISLLIILCKSQQQL